MNVNDSERIISMLSVIGYSRTESASEADLMLLNTCSVRGGAEEKLYRRLANLRVHKKAKRELIIGVGGCVAQQEGENLMRRLPWLDLVFGTHNLHLLPDLVKSAENGEKCCEISFIDNERRLDLFPLVLGERSVSSFVTVMQGCDNYCSYCIVPYVRGAEVSRRSSDIIEEVTALAASGVREVVLLGQNVNSYGLKTEGETDFAGLIKMVATVEGIERIRFTTSHPKDMSDALIECFATVGKLAGHIHLPAQSGSDSVLSKMKRGYGREFYLKNIGALKSARPGIAITGDMIVGFPGESEEDFEETLSLMEEVRYADLFSFIYSPRPGTEAARIPESIDKKDKLRRLEKLQELQRGYTTENNRGYIGTVQKILVEGGGKLPGQLSGKGESGRTVNFEGEASLTGTFADVRIIKAYQNSLLGELLHTSL